MLFSITIRGAGSIKSDTSNSEVNKVKMATPRITKIHNEEKDDIQNVFDFPLFILIS